MLWRYKVGNIFTLDNDKTSVKVIETTNDTIVGVEEILKKDINQIRLYLMARISLMKMKV